MSHIENCLFHGLPALRLRAKDGATAIMTLHGAHVVSWANARGVEQLYLSPNTRYASGQAIRGGVPVVFPQFNAQGVLPRHGFARTSDWRRVDTLVEMPADECSVTLTLPRNKVIKSLWPYVFACQLKIALHGDSLTISLTVSNDGDQTFSFQAALHTYLAIASITDAHLTGLENCEYEDCSDADPQGLKRHSALRPFEAIDRIYYNAPQPLVLQTAHSAVLLSQTGFSDVVVWNPGGAAAASPADLPKDGFRQFLCVEAAQIGTPAVLKPAEIWQGSQTLTAAR
jgi:glucose-6-phosphate 1-epimerase